MATDCDVFIVDAPVDKVFTYCTNPSNLPEIWPVLWRSATCNCLYVSAAAIGGCTSWPACVSKAGPKSLNMSPINGCP